MTQSGDTPDTRIDLIMEKASKALVERRYFDAARLSVEAMDAAHSARDYERMGRICLPLQEARRQIRDIAADTGKVWLIDSELPKPGKLKPGCYLVQPPRVGLDGRMLREMAEEREVPAIVLTREPTTRAGLWPLVTIGPVTVRTHVPPPQPRKLRKGQREQGPAAEPMPDSHWFLGACEAVGDAAIAAVDPARPVLVRVEEFLMRLQSHPSHEKLHQALMRACEEAALLPERERRDPPRDPLAAVEAGEAHADDDGL